MTTTDIPPIKTRRPTGKPPWPMILLAGAEKCGKSYSAAAFSASDLVNRTFWIEIGEGAADQYGALPGSRYEIVEHDGTYQGIGGAIYAATMQPRENGRPNAIVVDSMTELWDLLSDEAQQAANKRKGKGADAEVQITMDLWNVAKKRWRKVIDLLRTYDGPVILTSRLEQVAVVGANGQPTTAKALKIRAEKNLGYEVDAIVQIPEPRQYQLTGVRSVHWDRAPGSPLDYPEFTVDGLLRKLGLAEPDATQVRSYTAPRVDPALTPEDAANAVVRKAQRERRTEPPAPEQDPWVDAPPAEAPGDPKPSTDGQRTRLVLLCERRIGSSDRDRRLALLTQLTGRPIRSAYDLSFGEAHRAINRLVDEDGPYSAPNPRNGAATVPAVTEAALATPDAEAAAALAAGSDQLAADWMVAIQGADSHAELESIGRKISAAVQRGQLLQADRAALEAVWRDRKKQLPATEPQDDGPDGDGWSARGVAAMTAGASA